MGILSRVRSARRTHVTRRIRRKPRSANYRATGTADVQRALQRHGSLAGGVRISARKPCSNHPYTTNDKTIDTPNNTLKLKNQ